MRQRNRLSVLRSPPSLYIPNVSAISFIVRTALSSHVEHPLQQRNVLGTCRENDNDEVSHSHDSASQEFTRLAQSGTHSHPPREARDQHQKMTARGDHGDQQIRPVKMARPEGSTPSSIRPPFTKVVTNRFV